MCVILQSTYDLLTNNCNNFADDLVRNGLNLSSGVPTNILDIPRQFIQVSLTFERKRVYELADHRKSASVDNPTPLITTLATLRLLYVVVCVNIAEARQQWTRTLFC